MSRKQQLEKMGVTPGKLALIGLLSVVLVVVIVGQLPKSTPDNVSTAAATAHTAPADQASAASPEKPKELPPWPAINLIETVASDPFALPDWVDQGEALVEEVEDRPDRLAELQEQGASILIIADGRKSARIGEEKFGVGDILDGYQVSDITTQGILLNKLDPH